MREGYAAGMQADAAVGIAARRAVLQVSFDGHAFRRQLAAYLVVPAGVQVYFEQGVPV